MKFVQKSGCWLLSAPFLMLVLLKTVNAGTMFGYSALSSESEYKIINDKNQTIYHRPSDEVKKVDLRKNIAAIQTIFNTVSWFDDQGIMLADEVLGSEFKFNESLFAVYTPHADAKVFSREGKVYQSLKVKGIGVSHHSFGVLGETAGEFLLFSSQGKLLHSWMGIEKATLSEKFLVLENRTHQVSFFTDDGEHPFATEIQIKSMKLSDELLLYVDASGILRAYAPDRYLGSFSNVSDFGVSNSFYYVRDAFGLRVFDLQGKITFQQSNVPARLSVSHELLAFSLDTEAVEVVAGASGTSFVIPKADFFWLSDEQVMVQVGQQFQVYASTGAWLVNEWVARPEKVSFGLSEVAFQTDDAHWARVISPGGAESQQLRLDEIQVDHLSLTENRDQLNWLSF